MPHKTILVTGKNGQLGQSLKKLVEDCQTSVIASETKQSKTLSSVIASEAKQSIAEYEFVFSDRDQLDLSSSESIAAFFIDNHFDVIINCAAYTAVDKAESEPELADQINHLAVKQLAEIAKAQNTILIHISTDYVFDGQNHQPYKEDDQTDPQAIYGSSKLKGEQAMQAVNPKGAIIRTSWVYSEYGNNFVKTMLRLGKERDELGVIFDQVGTPTYATDLANAILQIVTVIARSDSDVAIQKADNNVAVIDRHASLAMTEDEVPTKNEIFHFSNEGVCSWYDFAKTIFELSYIKCKVNPIETKNYPTPAKRPHYSVLNKNKIKQAFKIEMPYWKDSLKKCLINIADEA